MFDWLTWPSPNDLPYTREEREYLDECRRRSWLLQSLAVNTLSGAAVSAYVYYGRKKPIRNAFMWGAFMTYTFVASDALGRPWKCRDTFVRQPHFPTAIAIRQQLRVLHPRIAHAREPKDKEAEARVIASGQVPKLTLTQTRPFLKALMVLFYNDKEAERLLGSDAQLDAGPVTTETDTATEATTSMLSTNVNDDSRLSSTAVNAPSPPSPATPSLRDWPPSDLPYTREEREYLARCHSRTFYLREILALCIPGLAIVSIIDHIRCKNPLLLTLSTATVTLASMIGVDRYILKPGHCHRGFISQPHFPTAIAIRQQLRQLDPQMAKMYNFRDPKDAETEARVIASGRVPTLTLTQTRPFLKHALLWFFYDDEKAKRILGANEHAHAHTARSTTASRASVTAASAQTDKSSRLSARRSPAQTANSEASSLSSSTTADEAWMDGNVTTTADVDRRQDDVSPPPVRLPQDPKVRTRINQFGDEEIIEDARDS